MAAVRSVTIDTCCINARGRSKLLNALEALAKRGDITIVSTRLLMSELASDESKLGPTRRAKAGQLKAGTSGFVMRRSGVRGGDVLRGPNAYRYREQIARILRPTLAWHELDGNTQRDVMHLAIHRAHDWDLFVTTDTLILSRHQELLSEVNVRVLSPEDAVRVVTDRSGP